MITISGNVVYRDGIMIGTILSRSPPYQGQPEPDVWVFEPDAAQPLTISDMDTLMLILRSHELGMTG